jgi:NAD(P)H-dependent FMN reductase
MSLKLHTIITSTRPGRVGLHVAKWFHEYAVGHGGFDTTLVDIADFNLPIYDEPVHPACKNTSTRTPNAGRKASTARTPLLS